MRKLAVQIESKNGTKTCHIFLPKKFVDSHKHDKKIKEEASTMFDRLGFTVLSVQRVVECGMELNEG